MVVGRRAAGAGVAVGVFPVLLMLVAVSMIVLMAVFMSTVMAVVVIMAVVMTAGAGGWLLQQVRIDLHTNVAGSARDQKAHKDGGYRY